MPVLCFYACPVFSLVLNYREPGAGYWKALKQTKGLGNETPTKVVRPQTLYFVLTSWDTNLSQNVRGMRLGSIATFHCARFMRTSCVTPQRHLRGYHRNNSEIENVCKQPLLGITMALQYAFKFADCFHELRK